MVVTFEEQYLQDLYEKGKAKEKKHRFQPQVVRGYQKAVKFLIQADRTEDLFPVKSLNFEALQGRAGWYSVRANGQYRVEFTVQEKAGETLATVCNIMDLSNHYQ